jgi:hypothetical protein
MGAPTLAVAASKAAGPAGARLRERDAPLYGYRIEWESGAA